MSNLKSFTNKFYPYMTKAYERSLIKFESLVGKHIITLRPYFGAIEGGNIYKVKSIGADAMGRYIVVQYSDKAREQHIYENDYRRGQWFLNISPLSKADFKLLDKGLPFAKQVEWEVKNLGSKINQIPHNYTDQYK